jgi:hypothetical protein
VEGAGPRQRIGHDTGVGAQDLAGDPLDPFGHLGSSASRECHQQDPARVCAVDDEMGYTVGKGIRLARASTRDDQQGSSDVTVGSNAVLDGSTLFRIERL